jgi:micrococcal nuclease
MSRWWKYEAQLVRVVDGDTIVCDIDLGLNTWARNQYVRLAGINAPEKTGLTKEAGLSSTAFLVGLLATGPYAPKLWLVTTAYHEYEKYGRVLAYVFTNDVLELTDPLFEESVNSEMVAMGYAVTYAP